MTVVNRRDRLISTASKFVWFELPSSTTVAPANSKTVELLSTGHENSRIMVVLAAKVDGINLKHYIVFK